MSENLSDAGKLEQVTELLSFNSFDPWLHCKRRIDEARFVLGITTSPDVELPRSKTLWGSLFG